MEQPRNSRYDRDRWELDRARYGLDRVPAPRRDIKPIGDVLKDVVDGIDQPVQENVLVLRKAWSKLVGKQIAYHSEPGFIKDFALHVFVDHPGWMSELERIKRPLQQKIQSDYRELGIRQLRFILQAG